MRKKLYMRPLINKLSDFQTHLNNNNKLINNKMNKKNLLIKNTNNHNKKYLKSNRKILKIRIHNKSSCILIYINIMKIF